MRASRLPVVVCVFMPSRLAKVVPGPHRWLVARFPQDPRGYYYMAMMRAMQNNADAALAMLEKAIALVPQLKGQAASDQQFTGLRGNPRFQQLVGSP